MLAASGTGAMEGAVTNLLSPGDEVDRRQRRQVRRALGEDRRRVRPRGARDHGRVGPGGRARRPSRARSTRTRRRARVYMQASETSTCALHPVPSRSRELTRAARHAAGRRRHHRRRRARPADGRARHRRPGHRLAEGADAAARARVRRALGARLEGRGGSAQLPRFYFDLKRERKGVAEHTTAWTPAISLDPAACSVALEHDARRGARQRLRAPRPPRARHARRRAGARPEAARPRRAEPGGHRPSMLPDGVDGGELVRYLRDRMGVTFAGGQDQLKGKIVRLAHLGYVGTFDVVTGARRARARRCASSAQPVDFGRGVGAARSASSPKACRRRAAEQERRGLSRPR